LLGLQDVGYTVGMDEGDRPVGKKDRALLGSAVGLGDDVGEVVEGGLLIG